MNQARDLRRVRKEDCPVRERRTDVLERALDLWTDWMNRSDRDLGTQMLKLPYGGSREDADYGSDTSTGDSAQQREDNKIAEAMHAMIYSLPRGQKWSIFRKQGISTTWNFPEIDFVSTAVAACAELERKMRINTATRMLW